jgi:hypothetical protein
MYLALKRPPCAGGEKMGMQHHIDNFFDGCDFIIAGDYAINFS